MYTKLIDYVRTGQSSLKFNDGKKIRTEEWALEDFLKLDPFARNRPVDKRVKKKREELKKKPLLTHLEVKVGRAVIDFGPYKAGDLYVNDGNTRAMVWTKFPELRPTQPLLVTIMDFDNESDSEDTYYSIDSASAAETSQEKIGGYFRSVNYFPISKKVRDGKISTTVNDATKYIKYFGDIPHKNATIFDKINYVFPELKFLDEWNLDGVKNLSSNLFSCMIMIAKKYGVNHPRFLEMIEHIRFGTSEHNDKQYCDGVYHVMVNLQTDNPDKWYITGHKKSPELLYEMLYSLDMFMTQTPIKKKKSYVVAKNQKHRDFFQSYIS